MMKPTTPLMASLYTYTLTKSPLTLYIPLTCRCNTNTLPQTRGPNFLLPPHVVACLLRVRDYQHDTNTWQHWCRYLDTQDAPQPLPPPPPPCLDSCLSNKEKYPSLLESLKQEIDEWIIANHNNNNNNKNNHLSLVVSGEGEPTLEWDTLQTLSHLYSTKCKIRVTTNGLVVPSSSSSCRRPRQLQEYGVDSISVALQTSDSTQYKELMQPHDDNYHGIKEDAHGRVCDFIQEAVQCGLQVQVTGVDRPDVDKQATQVLAQSLGVSSEMTWRPYFGDSP